MPNPRVPVLVVTGYAAAGKTRLVNQLLASRDDLRVGVIMHRQAEEFGIEPHGLADGLAAFSEAVYDFGSGCICCSPKGELTRLLTDMEWRMAGQQGEALHLDLLILRLGPLAAPHAPCATRSDSRWRRSSRSSIQPLRGGIFRPMVTSGRQERRSRALVAFGARLFLVLGALVHLGWAARSNRRLLADRFGAKAADGALGLVVRAVRATLGRHGADVIQVARAGRELAHGGRRLNVTHTKEKQMISRHDLHDHRNAAE
jgi:hypothetical protein